MAKKFQIVHGLLLLLLTICLAGCLADGVRSEPTRTAVVETEKKIAEQQPEAVPKAERQEVSKPLHAELYVDPVPEKARIRVMNIRPKFTQGMRLTAGRYHIEVTASGYRKNLQWITLEAGKMTRLKVKLVAQ